MILKINDKMKVESNFSHHKHETGEKRHNVSRLNVGSASWRSVIHRTTDNIKKPFFNLVTNSRLPRGQTE